MMKITKLLRLTALLVIPATAMAETPAIDFSKPVYSRAEAVLCPADRVLPQGPQHAAMILLLIELGPGQMSRSEWRAILAEDACRFIPAGVRLKASDEGDHGILVNLDGTMFIGAAEGLTN